MAVYESIERQRWIKKVSESCLIRKCATFGYVYGEFQTRKVRFCVFVRNLATDFTFDRISLGGLNATYHRVGYGRL
jgi:hypothetical protein